MSVSQFVCSCSASNAPPAFRFYGLPEVISSFAGRWRLSAADVHPAGPPAGSIPHWCSPDLPANQLLMYSLNFAEIQDANSNAMSLWANVPPYLPALENITLSTWQGAYHQASALSKRALAFGCDCREFNSRQLLRNLHFHNLSVLRIFRGKIPENAWYRRLNAYGIKRSFFMSGVDRKDAGAKSCVARVCGLLRLDFPFCNSNPQHLVMMDEWSVNVRVNL